MPLQIDVRELTRFDDPREAGGGAVGVFLRAGALLDEDGTERLVGEERVA